MSGNARHRSNTPRGWAFAILSLVVGVAAIVIAVAAFTIASPASDVVLEVETATLSAAPTTVPETATSPSSTSSTVPPAAPPVAPSVELSTTTTTTSTTLPPEVPPTALIIDDLGISQGVHPVGLEDDGSMEVPDVEDIGWYLHGATPGHPGATVIVAHVWWHKTAGPFHRLGSLEPGARIEVGSDSETVHEYTVVKRTMYDKDKLPADLWRKSGPETLVLITCGGTLNKATRRYEQNIVVYAEPIAEADELSST